MTINFEQRYAQRRLHDLAEKTKDFVFASEPDEPTDVSADELRLFQLHKLLIQVSQMVTKRFYKLPDSSRAMHDLDEWIQEMMLVLVEETERYDISKKVPYQKYITERITWRLKDYQNKIRRQESVTNKHVKQAQKELQQELGHEPTPEEIAEYLGCEVWMVLEQKRFVRPEDLGQIEAYTQSSANDEQLRKHMDTDSFEGSLYAPQLSPYDEWLRKRLWECINRLKPDQKDLFVRHELENESFPALFAEFCQIFGSKSVRSFQRHYGEQVFEPVKLCVEQGYD